MRGFSVFHARCLKFLRSRSLRTQGFSRYGDQGAQFLAHFWAEGCFCVYPGIVGDVVSRVCLPGQLL